MTKEPPFIAAVYTFPNGQTMVFDQYGKQMPEYQGPASEMEPKVRAAGFTGTIVAATWSPRCSSDSE